MMGPVASLRSRVAEIAIWIVHRVNTMGHHVLGLTAVVEVAMRAAALLVSHIMTPPVAELITAAKRFHVALELQEAPTVNALWLVIVALPHLILRLLPGVTVQWFHVARELQEPPTANALWLAIVALLHLIP